MQVLSIKKAFSALFMGASSYIKYSNLFLHGADCEGVWYIQRNSKPTRRST
jgi:hypothetical protein